MGSIKFGEAGKYFLFSNNPSKRDIRRSNQVGKGELPCEGGERRI